MINMKMWFPTEPYRAKIRKSYVDPYGDIVLRDEVVWVTGEKQRDLEYDSGYRMMVEHKGRTYPLDSNYIGDLMFVNTENREAFRKFKETIEKGLKPKEEKTMQIVLKNGLKIEATEAEVKRLLANQDTPLYHSSTHGLVPIKDMDSRHIKNAIVKKFKDFAGTSVYSISTEDFIKEFRALQTDETIENLVKELESR